MGLLLNIVVGLLCEIAVELQSEVAVGILSKGLRKALLYLQRDIELCALIV